MNCVKLQNIDSLLTIFEFLSLLVNEPVFAEILIIGELVCPEILKLPTLS